jgi:pimeloyl-ACP methyl ester carboxylesterase
MEKFESQMVTTGNYRTHLVTQGSGPLVLLLHGFPQVWYAWRHQLTALAEAGYRAAAIDLRGYGRSSKPRHIHDYRVTEYVADCIGVVKARRVHPLRRQRHDVLAR